MLLLQRNVSREGDRDACAIYLTQIDRISLLSKEEELKLGEAIQQGDEEALNKLVEANLRFVVKVAMRFQGYGLSSADLINEGNIGLMAAARRYSPDYNVKFIMYAFWWIQQAITQALASLGGIVRLPLHMVRRVSRLRKVRAELTRHFQYEPSDDELLEELEAPRFEMEEFRERRVASWFSNDISRQEQLSFELYQSDPLPRAEAELVEKSLREEMRRILKQLPPKERAVIELRYGFGEEQPLTLEEVGKRFQLSRERVRQIEERAKQKLRIHARACRLTDYLSRQTNNERGSNNG